MEGQTSAAEAVKRWHEENPGGTRRQCAEATGITYQTVCKEAKGLKWRPDRRRCAAHGSRAEVDASVSAWHARNPEGNRRSCAEELGIPYSVVCESARRNCPGWRGDQGHQRSPRRRDWLDGAVARWHSENPSGTRRLCAAELDVSYTAVCRAARPLDWPKAAPWA